MRKLILTAAASGLALLIAGCGPEAEQDAQNEAAAGLGMNAMMADPSKPFAEAELQMNERMMSAVGVNVGDSWVRKMIEHHRGAVDMSRDVLELNPSAHVAQMAQETIDTQTREIAELEKLIQQGQPDPQSAALYRPTIEQMHSTMMAASGSDLSETFHRKMLVHHRGAVALSDIALANGVTGAVRAQVEKTRASQLKEIAMIEAMLRGEPAPAAAATEPAASATREPPAASTARETPPAPKPAPAKPAPAKSEPAEPAPDPHAGHDMNNMQ